MTYDPRCLDCHGTGVRDSGGSYPWGEPIFVPCDCDQQPMENDMPWPPEDPDMWAVEAAFGKHNKASELHPEPDRQVSSNHVIVVNGKPRVGKDTSIEMMNRVLTSRGFFVNSFSSIDPVRNMLSQAGIDVTAKTPQDRDLLAEIGFSVEKHSHWRSRQCFAEINSMFNMKKFFDNIMFLHVREPEIIDRIRKDVLDSKWNFHTILVKSKRGEDIRSNVADASVHDIEYTQEIQNDGNLGDLLESCRQVLMKLKIIEK